MKIETKLDPLTYIKLLKYIKLLTPEQYAIEVIGCSKEELSRITLMAEQIRVKAAQTNPSLWWDDLNKFARHDVIKAASKL